MASLDYTGLLGGRPNWTSVTLADGRQVTVGGPNSRSTRNNNPGNLEYGPFAKSHGALGSDGRFAVFGTRAQGIKAQTDLVFGSKYANLTLAQAISKYAPAFENNSRAYAATVSQLSGIPLDTKMKDIPADQRTAVVEAMHQVEGTTPASVYDRDGNRIGQVDQSGSLDLRGADQPAWGAIGARGLQGYVPPGRPGIGTPAAGAMGARDMNGTFPSFAPSVPLSAPLDPVSRAALPDIPSPAMGALAASGLQGMNSPAAGARAASEMQGYVPGSITLPDVPAALSTPPAVAAPMSYPSVANPPAGLTLSLPGTTTLQGVHTMPAAPRDMPALPSPVAPPAQVPSALPSVPAPPVDPAATRSLPSIATPPTGLSISLPSAVPPTSVQTSKAGLIADFPEAPPAPGRQAAIDAAKGAAKGIMAGGLPGMIGGAILGPAMAQIGRNRASNALGVGSRISPFNGVLGAYKNIFGRMGLPSFGSIFGGMAPNYGASPFGVGSGYGAIGSTFGAPAGATAFSRSNPEVSFTSLGNGYVSRSNSKTGVTSVMSSDDYDPGTAGRGGSSSSGKGSSSSGKGTGGLF